MSENSAIEWTDATWNPVTGCTKISAGCDNCYAARFSERFRGVPGHPFETGFDLTLRPERLLQPLAWKRPRMIFVNSMSDPEANRSRRIIPSTRARLSQPDHPSVLLQAHLTAISIGSSRAPGLSVRLRLTETLMPARATELKGR